MYTIEFIDSVSRLGAERWNAIAGTDYPFTRHEFFSALENSGATEGKTGWLSRHAVVLDERDEAVALLPLYLKFHSFGEYVFDWSWADAWRQYGLDYYPKLLSAIPYTPATGPRLLSLPGVGRDALMDTVCGSVQELAQRENASSAHLLFPDNTTSAALHARGWMQRIGSQYHWLNNGYRDFDDFLSRCASRKRKTLRKERQRVLDQGVSLRLLSGSQIDEELWRLFHRFYQTTYAKRSGHGGYLGERFFIEIGRTMPEHLVMALAEYRGRPVAAALNFRDSQNLYGRYWGCLAEFDMLHFETCYYQGIDYCIAENLKRFDPGAQGEHKIQRGFAPVETYSNHWIGHEPLRAAVENFLEREARATRGWIDEAKGMLPFKHS